MTAGAAPGAVGTAMSGPDGGTGPDAQVAADLQLVLGRLVRRLRAVGGEAVTASQLSALANLEEHGPLRLRDLATHEGIKPPTASRLVDLLVDRRLVARSDDPGDGRGTRVALTSEGRALLSGVRADRNARLAAALARLPAPDADRIAAAVPLLHALLGELPPPGR